MKTCSTGFSATAVNRDPVCFAHLLRLLDGVCAWEERSKSSIVHVAWTKGWISAIGRFDYTIRRMVRITEASLVEADGSNTPNGQIEDEFEKGTMVINLIFKKVINSNPSFHLDSGIDDDDEPSPGVILFSKKLKQIKDFFKREKFNPSAIELLLTAHTAMDDTTEKESSVPGGRSRRERSSSNAEKPVNNGLEKGPPQKKARLTLN